MNVAVRKVLPKHPRPVILPFLNSTPIVDLQILFILLPFWWVLGVEQFVWPVGLLWIAFKVVLKRDFKITVVTTLKWLVIFLCVYLFSGFFIREPSRIITFLRNFSTYISAALLVLIITNIVKSEQDLKRLVFVPVIVLTIASIVGLLAITDLLQPAFTSFVGYLLPSSIKATDYGGRVAFKELGSYSWFVGLGRYFRVRSFFLYGTLYASALVVVIPVSFFLQSQAGNILKKGLIRVGIVLLLSNLIFTTARIAFLSLVLGYLYYLAFASIRKNRARILLALLIIVLIMGAFMTILAAQQFSALTDLAVSNVTNFSKARGEGSLRGRLFVYEQTWVGWLERPLLGWGTERDIPDFPFPAGSHSYYLGTLYKQGLIGFLVFLAMLVALWKDTDLKRIGDAAALKSTPYKLLRYGRWCIVIVLVNGFTDVLDLDAVTMAVIWFIFALLIAAQRLCTLYGEERYNAG